MPPEGDSVWKQVNSVRLGLFVVQHTSATGGDCSTADDLHPPLKRIFALCSEIIDVGLEMQFEDVVLVDVFGL